VDWGQTRGQVVFDSALCPLTELDTSGFSIVGGRSLRVTDHPAVYVHDTGGFGSPFVAALDPAADPGAHLALTDRSTRLSVEVAFPGGRTFRATTTNPLPPEALTRLTYLGGRLLPESATAGFVSPCAVSVTPLYEQPPEPADPAALPPATELTAYVVVTGGRLELRTRGGDVSVYWPVNRVVATPTGPASVDIRGGALMSGQFLAGAVLHLATPQVRASFLAVVGSVRPDPAAAVGTSAPVTVHGLAEATDVDCVLGESVLELQAQETSKVLARFELADPRLRVAGSAERFVVFNPDHGPVTVHVQSGSEAFGRRLQEHPGVRAAAQRTLATGPYPAELADGRPVACAVTAEAVRVKGPGVDLTIPFAGLGSVEGTATVPRASLRVTTDRTVVTIIGQSELVQAVHTEIAAGSNATANAGQVPDMLRAAVGLEEDYFLYTVFGPFYELHAALLGDATADQLATPATPPDSEEDRARMAAVLAEGLLDLQRHLDQVGSVLPAFVRHRDAQLLAPVGDPEPDWLKLQEGQLRAAFGPVQRAASETAGLAGQASRLLDLDPESVPRASYAGAAVSLGAAALFNPVFAVSGVSQAYSQYSQREKRKAEVSAQSARGWALVLDRWNTLVSTSVPVLAYVLTENLFGLRWEAARRLTLAVRDLPAERREPVLRNVARRLARLDVMRRYPMTAGIRLRRGEIADHLRAAREAVRTPRFADF
jgi:hypothetical protein